MYLEITWDRMERLSMCYKFKGQIIFGKSFSSFAWICLCPGKESDRDRSSEVSKISTGSKSCLLFILPAMHTTPVKVHSRGEPTCSLVSAGLWRCLRFSAQSHGKAPGSWNSQKCSGTRWSSGQRTLRQEYCLLRSAYGHLGLIFCWTLSIIWPQSPLIIGNPSAFLQSFPEEIC